MNKRTYIGTGLLVVLLAVGTAPADAQAAGRQASVSSATACMLNLQGVADLGPVLSVTTLLENKSSGGLIAEVRSGEIGGTYKKKTVRGNASFPLGDVDIADLVTLPAPVDPDLTVTAHFPLCNEDGTVRPEVVEARELNGSSTIDYGVPEGDEPSRSVTNRCTDDPGTAEDEGAVKVDDATFLAIADACNLLIP